MTWNNGDGNDTNDGEDGVDETQINGRNTTDDATVQNVAGGRVLFDRIAPGPFNVEHGDGRAPDRQHARQATTRSSRVPA